ncbi:hypothetical protein LTR66_017772, partial [Elasticomyces elasticus]
HTEVDDKHHELLEQYKSEKPTAHNGNFDVVVYGTPEHLSAIRDVQNHHLSKRETLRIKNAELFQEFDNVHKTLDHLNEELNRLTDHAVALDASFNKYGYTANIRTKEDAESPSASSNDLAHTDTVSSQADRHADKSIDPIRFFKCPTIRQYFHKGLLWRSARSGEVGTFELFTDLIYVGVIDYIGEAAVTNASAETFLHFVVVFSLAYKIWSDLTVTINWFEVEDCVGRLFVLFIIICLYGFNSNVEEFFGETFTAGIAFYLVQRITFIIFYLICSFMVPMIRGSMLAYSALALFSAVLYITAIHIEYPYNLAPLFIAIAADFSGGAVLMICLRWIKHKAGRSGICNVVTRQFDFFPAINIEHRTERTSAFTTLVFGYSILKSLYQSRAHVGVNAFLGKGILAVIQAFAIMWLYFDLDAWAIHVHAIRRHWATSTVWVVAHLPLSAALILASSTLSELVLAHDCAKSNIEDLTEQYAASSHEIIEQPLRWFYCGGLAVTLLSMAAISATHHHKKITKPRFRKPFRLAFRCAIALIILLLPLAHENLNSINLVAITTCLIVLVLIMDIFGNSCGTQKFWTGGMCKESNCRYTARLHMGKKRKADLQQRMLEGREVSLGNALRRSDSIGSQVTVDVDEDWH